MSALEQLCRGKVSQLPHVDPRTLYFFICSSYSDFEKERRILLQQAYPQLRDYCQQKYGLQFRLIDTKLGLEDRILEDLSYFDHFVRERDQYCELSADCCPVILLGQSYGQLLLPQRIPSGVYNLLRSTLRAHRNNVTRFYYLLDDWYRRDENSTTGSNHVLIKVERNIPQVKDKNLDVQLQAIDLWRKTRRQLSNLIQIGFTCCLKEGSLDTETVADILVYELESSVSSTMDKFKGEKFYPIVLQREIMDIRNYVSYPMAHELIDVEYSESDEREVQLNNVLNSRLRGLCDAVASKRWISHEPFFVLWRFPDGINEELHEPYLKDFNASFVQCAMEAIDQRASNKVISTAPPSYIKVYDDVWTSLASLTRRALPSAGHEEVVKSLLAYTQDSAGTAPVVLRGPDSSTKEAVVARCFRELQKRHSSSSDVFLITRAISGPTTISQLTESLADQVNIQAKLTGEQNDRGVSKTNRTFPDLVCILPKLYKFIILLSGTEYVVDEDNKTVGILTHLPARLPENVKLIVTDMHDCDGSPGAFTSYSLKGMESPGWYNCVTAYVNGRGRRLTEDQRQQLQRYLPRLSDTSSLTAVLLGEILCQLTSSENLDVDHLPTDADGFLGNYFHTLEAAFGSLLVGHASALITASGNGLTDQEVEDILSLDNELMATLPCCTDQQANITRFPGVLWTFLKDQMKPVLQAVSKDGFFVYFWVDDRVTEITKTLYYIEQKRVYFHDLMADYFLGTWNSTPKPFVCIGDQPTATHRLLPSQSVTFGTERRMFFNVRQYHQLPRNLLLSQRTEELNRMVIFNYNWIYSKTKALGLDETLKDYALVEQNMDIILVEESLRKSAAILRFDVNNLAAELLGQLLPYSYLYRSIKGLVNQCDQNGSAHNCFLPVFSYSKLPGSALQSTVVCPSAVQNIYVDEKSGLLIVKLENDTSLYRYDLNRGEMTDSVCLSHGEAYLTPDFSKVIVLESERRSNIKIHNAVDGKLCGQVTPGTWVDPEPFKQISQWKFKCLDVSGEHLAIVFSNYVFVVRLDSCKPIHIFNPTPKATIAKLSPNERFLYTNSGDQLLVFDITNGEQVSAVSLLAVPLKIIFSQDLSRGFIICDEATRVVVLHINQGHIEMSYKIVFEKSLGTDSVSDIKLSIKNDLLLIRAEKSILVYDFSVDSIISHIHRPAEIPEDFKLPNSEYKMLNFTEADFAFDDQVVIASIFRDILIWNIKEGVVLATLHAPVGIITRLIVDRTRNGLVGYVQHSGEIHLWNLTGPFTDGTVIDALTAPVSQICVAEKSPRAIAICRNSDEMGVVDLQTGFLTDLYTHEGPVVQCAVSSGGDYAVVGIRTRRLNATYVAWCLKTRRILQEFGDVIGYVLPGASEGQFLHVAPRQFGFGVPYEISLIECNENSATITTNPDILFPFVLSQPFITADGENLVALSADVYNESKTAYDNQHVLINNIRDKTFQKITAELLQNYGPIQEIMDVRLAATAQQSPLLIVLFTSSVSDEVGSNEIAEDEQNKGVLLFDVTNACVLQIADNLFSKTTSVLFSGDGQFAFDFASNLYSIAVGDCMGQFFSEDVSFIEFVLQERVVVMARGQLLLAFRIPEGTLIGKVNVHDNISFICKLPDDRSVAVGCESGHVLCYAVVDPVLDDVDKVIQSIPSRNFHNKDRTRSWDRIVQHENGADYKQSSLSGRRKLQGSDDNGDGSRKKSGSPKPVSNVERAKSCSVM